MLYTIWVIPPKPLYITLQHTITTLAETYASPVFEPHVTLLGNIDAELSEVEQKTKELIHTLHTSPFELRLGPVSFSTTYFQSVFVRVQSTATLMQLNYEAKKVFNMPNDIFMPHISLLYGDHNMQTRAEAAATVTLPSTSFTVNNFVIVPSMPNPSEWQHVAMIQLQSHS